MTKFEKFLKKYSYSLPPGLIAQTPAMPRDNARLLIYNRRSKKTAYDRFANIAKYLPKNAVLVFNQTKVWPARLKIIKSSGGKAELLYLSHDKNLIKALSNRPLRLKTSVALLRGRAIMQQGVRAPKFQIVKKLGQFYYLKPNFPISRLPDVLKKHGITPLPPYIKHSPLTEKERRRQYQSVFARQGLSVAAPTASLHFTVALIRKLKKQGISTAFVRLDVGLGTFAPLKEQNIADNKLHQEYYSIDKKTAVFLNKAKQQGKPIIAVGTTVTRTLEAAAKNSKLTNLTGSTDLFIRENYRFKFIDGLITNFHVPKSSLLMLVSALTGRQRLLKLYQQAIKRQFRFFSFGDGMLILNH